MEFLLCASGDGALSSDPVAGAGGSSRITTQRKSVCADPPGSHDHVGPSCGVRSVSLKATDLVAGDGEATPSLSDPEAAPGLPEVVLPPAVKRIIKQARFPDSTSNVLGKERVHAFRAAGCHPA